MEYHVTIGIEIHCQLKTKTKMFSGAPTSFGRKPNVCTNEIDLGHPGTLPCVNKEAVAKGNVQAANWIRDTSGNKPVEKVEANVENKNADISAIKDIANQMKDVDDIDVST